MSRGTGLDLAKASISLWNENHPGESLYLQCQRESGAYTQRAFQGNWDFQTYYSAAVAADVAQKAGRIYTTDLNDSRIEAGEKVYYRWGTYGHVCNIIGRDAGGLLVTNTANAGDDLGQLGNHVKISHAHTLGLEIIGVSSRDGNNAHITDFDMWLPGGTPPTPQPAGQDDWINLDGWYWFDDPNKAMQLRGAHTPLIFGERDVLGIEANGSIRIAAKDGTVVWVHSSARDRIFYKNGTPAPAQPSGNWYFDIPTVGQYYYNQYNNALNGNYDPNQMIYFDPDGNNSRLVVENPGSGPVRIQAKDGSLIWVGTRNNPAPIRQG